MLHDSRDYLGTRNNLMLIGVSKIYDNTFGDVVSARSWMLFNIPILVLYKGLFCLGSQLGLKMIVHGL